MFKFKIYLTPQTGQDRHYLKEWEHVVDEECKFSKIWPCDSSKFSAFLVTLLHISIETNSRWMSPRYDQEPQHLIRYLLTRSIHHHSPPWIISINASFLNICCCWMSWHLTLLTLPGLHQDWWWRMSQDLGGEHSVINESLMIISTLVVQEDL